MTERKQRHSEAGQPALSLLAIDVKHLPEQTARFPEALAAFVANQEDVTGLRIYNLREVAKSLSMDYERIESLLQVFDTMEQALEKEEPRGSI